MIRVRPRLWWAEHENESKKVGVRALAGVAGGRWGVGTSESREEGHLVTRDENPIRLCLNGRENPNSPSSTLAFALHCCATRVMVLQGRLLAFICEYAREGIIA
jgi:hypothetical protein